MFVDNPDIPMDNNIAERTIRGGVLGRKNYYGRGSQWSAELTAGFFTILMTLNLWGINPKLWLTGDLSSDIQKGAGYVTNLLCSYAVLLFCWMGVANSYDIFNKKMAMSFKWTYKGQALQVSNGMVF